MIGQLFRWIFPWTHSVLLANRRTVERAAHMVMVPTLVGVGAWGAYSWCQGNADPIHFSVMSAAVVSGAPRPLSIGASTPEPHVHLSAGVERSTNPQPSGRATPHFESPAMCRSCVSAHCWSLYCP
jgi:hypothetical protein